MKHSQATIISAFVTGLGEARFENIPHAINNLPATPSLILGISDDGASSVKSSRDSRTGKIVQFHGIRFMLRAPTQSQVSLLGNALMQTIDQLPKTSPQKTVTLPDPESTEETELPDLEYTVVNLSRISGVGIDRVPGTQEWVYTFTCRATITE